MSTATQPKPRIKTEAQICCEHIPINQALVGEWAGNIVTVEYIAGRESKVITRSFTVKTNYPGRCLCWVFNPKKSLIPIVTEEVKIEEQ